MPRNPETSEHFTLKKLLRNKFEEWYGPSIDEYPGSGHELDVFSVTYKGIKIMVEIIWTPTKTNFFRDMGIVYTSDARIKVVAINPKLFSNEEITRWFQKLRVSEASKGYVLLPLFDGLKLLQDASYVAHLKETLDELTKEKITSLMDKIASLKEAVLTDDPLAPMISDCLDLARTFRRKEQIEWLERELYGFPEMYKETKLNITALPGNPVYRLVQGDVQIFETRTFRFRFAISQPVSEIEQWIEDYGDVEEVAIRMDTPTEIAEIARRHKLQPSDRMPVIVSLSSLKRVLTQLRLRLHQFVNEIEESLK